MDFKPADSKTVVPVLRALAHMVSKLNKTDREFVARELNDFIDDLVSMRVLGKSGHEDPRGDR